MQLLVKRFGRLLIPILAVLLLLSCQNKSTDYQLTDIYQITQYINNDPTGKAVFPAALIDSASRAARYAKLLGGTSDISPLDYWVEVVSHYRDFTADCAGKGDSLNNFNTCEPSELENGIRAKLRSVTMKDTLYCKYHIVNSTDSAVTIKSVRFASTFRGQMAKLNSDGVPYRGWALYSVGRKGMGVDASGISGRVDSIVVTSTDLHYAVVPTSGNTYTTTTKLPKVAHGDLIVVQVYTRTGTLFDITDAYLHYSVNGRMVHEPMSMRTPGVFVVDDLEESSGAPPRGYSQVVIELFTQAGLRDSRPTAFDNFIWAITYKLAD